MPENPQPEQPPTAPIETESDADVGPLPASPTSAPPPPASRQRNFFLTALLFEVGLGVAALSLGWLLGLTTTTMGLLPAEPALPLAAAVGAGVLATLPMVVALIWLDRFPPRWLKTFRDQVSRIVVPLFRGLAVWQLGLLALAAGVGEELLFRGLLQAGLSTAIGGSWGLVVGLLVASIAFGVCHYLNFTYAVLAGLVGLYFGALLIVTDQLLTPIIAHGLYDFVALVYLVRSSRS